MDGYHLYKSIGICVCCHKRQAEPNKVMCFECADKTREYDYIRRERNINKYKQKDLDKYYLLKQKGICTYCKHEKALNGKTKCAKCLAKIRNKRQAKMEDIPRCERSSYGICYFCGVNPVMKDKKVCETCYQTRLMAMKKCNENRVSGFNSYWKEQNKLIFKQ